MRARQAALQAALGSIQGRVDPAARKGVLAAVEVWTGAYRVLEERDDGATVTVRVEVEVDLGRLHKRLVDRARTPSARPGYSFGKLVLSQGCEGLAVAADEVERELTELGALGATGPRVSFELRCQQLGRVQHTHVHAARVELEAATDDGEIRAVASAFGSDQKVALEVASEDALAEVALGLVARREQALIVRVESSGPAARIRRFERALVASVVGVRRVEVGGVEPAGIVRLRVVGDLTPTKLARGIGSLRASGITVQIGAIDAKTVTVRID